MTTLDGKCHFCMIVILTSGPIFLCSTISNCPPSLLTFQNGLAKTWEFVFSPNTLPWCQVNCLSIFCRFYFRDAEKPPSSFQPLAQTGLSLLGKYLKSKQPRVHKVAGWCGYICQRGEGGCGRSSCRNESGHCWRQHLSVLETQGRQMSSHMQPQPHAAAVTQDRMLFLFLADDDHHWVALYGD